jgi:hypothetical protein
MGDVRLPGRPSLALMGFDREIERAVDAGEVGGRMMLGDGVLQGRTE